MTPNHLNAARELKLGTPVRDLYHYSSTGTIVPVRRGDSALTFAREGKPDWYNVRDDQTGGVQCIHRSMLAVRNDVAQDGE